MTIYKKRTSFTTLGELRKLLFDMPDDTKLFVMGLPGLVNYDLFPMRMLWISVLSQNAISNLMYISAFDEDVRNVLRYYMINRDAARELSL